MSSVPNDNTNHEAAPFFTDPRSLIARLRVEKREWRPHQPEHNCPPVVSGLVVERDSYIDMNGDPAPTLRLLADDLRVEWSVIGFHGWLKSGILKQNPQPGDYALLAFTGTRPTAKKGESPAFTYEVLVERNPSSPPPVQSVPTTDHADESDEGEGANSGLTLSP